MGGILVSESAENGQKGGSGIENLKVFFAEKLHQYCVSKSWRIFLVKIVGW